MPFLLDYPTNATIGFVRQNFVNWTYGGGLPTTQTARGNPCAVAICQLSPVTAIHPVTHKRSEPYRARCASAHRSTPSGTCAHS